MSASTAHLSDSVRGAVLLGPSAVSSRSTRRSSDDAPPPERSCRSRMVARQDPTAPGRLAMLARLAKHRRLMSSSQSAVRGAPGAHAKKAMWTARPSSFWQPELSVSYAPIMHLYTDESSESLASAVAHVLATSSRQAFRKGGSSFQLAWRRCSLYSTCIQGKFGGVVVNWVKVKACRQAVGEVACARRSDTWRRCGRADAAGPSALPFHTRPDLVTARGAKVGVVHVLREAAEHARRPRRHGLAEEPALGLARAQQADVELDAGGFFLFQAQLLLAACLAQLVAVVAQALVHTALACASPGGDPWWGCGAGCGGWDVCRACICARGDCLLVRLHSRAAQQGGTAGNGGMRRGETRRGGARRGGPGRGEVGRGGAGHGGALMVYLLNWQTATCGSCLCDCGCNANGDASTVTGLTLTLTLTLTLDSSLA
eukprot:365130-Chlamydomonas_euryale.AAC.16